MDPMQNIKLQVDGRAISITKDRYQWIAYEELTGKEGKPWLKLVGHYSSLSHMLKRIHDYLLKTDLSDITTVVDLVDRAEQIESRLVQSVQTLNKEERDFLSTRG